MKSAFHRLFVYIWRDSESAARSRSISSSPMILVVSRRNRKSQFSGLCKNASRTFIVIQEARLLRFTLPAMTAISVYRWRTEVREYRQRNAGPWIQEARLESESGGCGRESSNSAATCKSVLVLKAPW